jgi:hypothetical protein
MIQVWAGEFTAHRVLHRYDGWAPASCVELRLAEFGDDEAVADVQFGHRQQ